MRKYPVLTITLILIAIILVSLTLGRYPMTLAEIYHSAADSIAGRELTYKQSEIIFLITEIRLPRIIAAVLVGSALAVSGAAYQAMFVNPLVSPGILGVLAGASFGAAVGIVIIESWIATQIMAFVFACAAVGLAVLLSLLLPRSTLLVLILGGMISGSLFTSLSSLLKYIADPTSQLPELVYWLMGTLANATNTVLIHVGFIMVAGIVFLCFQGKLLNVLSLGDEEAQALGISVKRKRIEIIAAATLVSASTVVIAGTIGWVGLVVPHMARFFVGPDNRVLMPVTAIGGGAFMLLTDSVVRSAFTMEIPIGIVTSLVSLPLVVFAMYQNKGRWR
ncbi:iron ABC transporter permease [Geovibrio thiophilus]|uniref:Iron ABC transporter permease n=1 Tax=Geovibrio thiophilus TaxID=139438 RepID=A0A3R5UZG2_9BACT|nr:iron ABC transporter permease [Geovibrio thiophilus]QAR33515.1 iron ABC transporter permease [Geovibrio thiophilus]